MYVWKKNYWIDDTILDELWESPCKKYVLEPVISGSEPMRKYKIRGSYQIDHDRNDQGYKEKAIREIENLFACYSLFGYHRSVEINYFIADDPISPDANKVSREVGPIRLGIKRRYNKNGFDDAYILYQKLLGDANYENYERCIRWYKNGLMQNSKTLINRN